jgi:hypothetical protein
MRTTSYESFSSRIVRKRSAVVGGGSVHDKSLLLRVFSPPSSLFSRFPLINKHTNAHAAGSGPKKEADEDGKDGKESGVVKANKGMILRKSVEYIRWVSGCPLLQLPERAPAHTRIPQIPPTTRRGAGRAQPRARGAAQGLPRLVWQRLAAVPRRQRARAGRRGVWAGHGRRRRGLGQRARVDAGGG